MTATEVLVREVAKVLAAEQSNGLCDAHRRCDLCDCNGSVQGYAWDQAAKVVAAIEPHIDATVDAGIAAWAKTARVDLDNLTVAGARLRDVLDAETCGEPQ